MPRAHEFAHAMFAWADRKRLLRGPQREQILAVNTSLAAQPFIRPEARATTIYGRPFGARKHKQNLDPLGMRTA